MSIATIIFTLVVIIYSKNISLTKIRFIGVLFLIGYLGYILKLSNLI